MFLDCHCFNLVVYDRTIVLSFELALTISFLDYILFSLVFFFLADWLTHEIWTRFPLAASNNKKNFSDEISICIKFVWKRLFCSIIWHANRFAILVFLMKYEKTMLNFICNVSEDDWSKRYGMKCVCISFHF